MKHYQSTDITRKSGEILEDALHGPVAITKYRKPKYVIMSALHYEALVHGREGREVFSLDTVPEDVRSEMLAGIEESMEMWGALSFFRDENDVYILGFIDQWCQHLMPVFKNTPHIFMLSQDWGPCYRNRYTYPRRLRIRVSRQTTLRADTRCTDNDACRQSASTIAITPRNAPSPRN